MIRAKILFFYGAAKKSVKKLTIWFAKLPKWTIKKQGKCSVGIEHLPCYGMCDAHPSPHEGSDRDCLCC